MLDKIYLSDGFWIMMIEEDEKCKFTYVMPNPLGIPIGLVILSELQIGWAEIPTYFCATTETGRKLIQK